jgi:hypothetical protein
LRADARLALRLVFGEGDWGAAFLGSPVPVFTNLPRRGPELGRNLEQSQTVERLR